MTARCLSVIGAIHVSVGAMSLEREILEEHLRQAEEHVAKGERALAKQSALVIELERDGHGTEAARQCLKQFEELQAVFVAGRDRLRDALAHAR